MKFLVIVLLSIICSGYANATDINNYPQDALDQFRQNPLRFSQQIPPKWMRSGQKLLIPNVFSVAEVASRNFVTTKDKTRSQICRTIGHERVCPQLPGAQSGNKAAIDSYPDSFFEGLPHLSNIRQMDEFRKVDLQFAPWSDTYWPLYKGALGQRYSDPNYPGSSNWLTNFNYADPLKIFEEPDKSILAPSEKYDVITGDLSKTLTKSMWQAGREYYDRFGTVEGWMGFCHGWAPASYMLPRPNKSVEVLAADGRTKVKFYPADIKALATLLWANAGADTLFVGGRCQDKNPKVDENGRILSPNCFDTNPGVWHLALINRMKNNLPFVFDAAFDFEVWNQPVLGYSYSYFNPQTSKTTDAISEAIVPISEFTEDKFKKYRSAKTKFVVGIGLRLKYLSENTPSPRETDGIENDRQIETYYMYDLELDQNENIIGGEWYNSAHPDFIWTPERNGRAEASTDYAIDGVWQTTTPMPQDWRKASTLSARYGQPLAHVVEALIQAAQ